MNNYSPLVTIIIPSFNRAHTIERAINSVLNQTYKNIEIIIIDDGSTDNTQQVLNKYQEPNIRIYKHEKNKGVTATKNNGLNQIKGEWFTILDSDDEIVPCAIERMMKMPLEFDHLITAVTCNCLDTETNKYSGFGLSQDQYLDERTLMTTCKGEFWGITKTCLLDNDRFNEKISGCENILWYKINGRVKRYYIHAALRIYHTEGNDRIIKSKYNYKQEIALYETLIYEPDFLSKKEIYNPTEFFSICKMGITTMKGNNKDELAKKYYDLFKKNNKNIIVELSYRYRFISLLQIKYKIFKRLIKSIFLQ